MTNTIILTTAAIALFAIGLTVNHVLAQGPEMEVIADGVSVTAKAVPDWVDNNFKWYGEGKIGQSDLLNSLTYMLDNNFMHLSDKAAQEVSDLRTKNFV